MNRAEVPSGEPDGFLRGLRLQDVISVSFEHFPGQGSYGLFVFDQENSLRTIQ